MTTVPDYDIQAALNDRFSDEFPTMPTAWENVPYTPIVGTAYFAAHLLPAEPDVLTLGSSPWIERRGIFQVSCFYPALAGWGTAKSGAADIVEAFPAGLQFSYNGLLVTIELSWPGPGMQQDGWYMCPVSIRYHCHYQG